MKIIGFLMEISLKIVCKICQKMKRILFYMYITENDPGDQGKCVGTSPGSYRLKKLSKIVRIFIESIIIGIPIQIDICCRSSFLENFGQKCFAQENRPPEAAIESYCMSSEFHMVMPSTLHGAGAHAANVSDQSGSGARRVLVNFHNL